MKDTYIAKVENVVKDTKTPYAVTDVEGVGKITFSLHSPIWDEKIPIKKGQFVVLSGLVKSDAGWRANKARFMKPEDEPSKRN